MSAQNFIGFLTIVGFFLGIIFALLKMPDAFEVPIAVCVVTILFYMIGIVSSSLFVKFLDFKPRFTIQTDIYEKVYDKALFELRRKEINIKEGVDFIKKLEMEEAEEYRKEQAALKAQMRRYRQGGGA
ncbi:MAG: hypothetical protein RL154_534 [Pseudomonadota bacterium]|jgi:hypothetical protein